ncbi:MAG: glycine cleavage system protein GcvH [Actinobacteria bacterium]|nr:glycine cleavage system protein GcvH [Actinomycetota bacterium]MCL6094893.1 glycine cleavage system protein GcvH [Actinomycetota bacterium]
MNIPHELRYTQDHEWAKLEANGLVRVGITDYAQDALGDVVFVDLPEVSKEIEAGDVLGEIESTKSVSEVYAPVGGVVVEVNSSLVDSPEKINQDPYGAGWMCLIKPSAGTTLEELMDAEGYARTVSGEET